MKLALWTFRPMQRGKIHVHRELPSGRGAQEVLWEPGNFQDDEAKRVGVRFASNTDLELWEQGVIDNMIIFQKPFRGRPHRA